MFLRGRLKVQRVLREPRLLSRSDAQVSPPNTFNTMKQLQVLFACSLTSPYNQVYFNLNPSNEWSEKVYRLVGFHFPRLNKTTSVL